MKYSELTRQWRLRSGLAPLRDECALDYSAGIDADRLVDIAVADWYTGLVADRRFDLLIDSDVSESVTVTMSGANIVRIALPPEVLVPTALEVENSRCVIIDAAASPRLARLILESDAAPASGLEAVFDSAGRALYMPFCRRLTSDEISCRALLMPPASPPADYDYPVRPEACRFIPKLI